MFLDALAPVIYFAPITPLAIQTPTKLNRFIFFPHEPRAGRTMGREPAGRTVAQTIHPRCCECHHPSTWSGKTTPSYTHSHSVQYLLSGDSEPGVTVRGKSGPPRQTSLDSVPSHPSRPASHFSGHVQRQTDKDAC